MNFRIVRAANSEAYDRLHALYAAGESERLPTLIRRLKELEIKLDIPLRSADPGSSALTINVLMRFAILSDLHANLEATEAVLADARERECTHFVCLGDVVGYNANPHECVEIVQKMECPVVKGNHDEQASLDGVIARISTRWRKRRSTGRAST